jgi:hypothetical protein
MRGTLNTGTRKLKTSLGAESARRRSELLGQQHGLENGPLVALSAEASSYHENSKAIAESGHYARLEAELSAGRGRVRGSVFLRVFAVPPFGNAVEFLHDTVEF